MRLIHNRQGTTIYWESITIAGLIGTLEKWTCLESWENRPEDSASPRQRYLKKRKPQKIKGYKEKRIMIRCTN